MTDIPVKTLIYNHEKFFISEAAPDLDAVIQYELTGEEGGDYIIAIKDGKISEFQVLVRIGFRLVEE